MNDRKVIISLLREIETTDNSDDILRRFEVIEKLNDLDKSELLLAIENLLKQDISLKLTLYLLEIRDNLGEKIPDLLILDCLKSQDPEIREWACILAPSTYSDLLFEPLNKIVSSDISPNVRVAAVYALGKMGNKNALATLERVKETDHEVNREGISVSMEATKAINKMKT